MDFEGALRYVQSCFNAEEVVGEEKHVERERIAAWAMAGKPGARNAAIKALLEFFGESGLKVKGMEPQRAAYEIYRELWGLGPLEEVYRDPGVNELEVNAPDKVYVLKDLRLEPVPGVGFRSDAEVIALVKRMIMHDRGASFDHSKPTVEAMRMDGTRITATCPPVTEGVTLCLRKHIQKAVPFEDMIARGVMDARTAELLKLLVRGRANIAIIGGVGSGKTTLLRTMFGESDPRARVVTLESDRELHLLKNYPDRNIVEMEEHPEVGCTLKVLFRTVLRYTPTFIIVGEFRGEGEAIEAVRACERGHDGSMTTAHFGSAQEFVEGTARLLLKEGLTLPQDALEALVASAFNVTVRMFGDPTRGIMRLEAVSELVPGGRPRDLVVWEPRGTDGRGVWKQVDPPSERLLARLDRYGVPPGAVGEVMGLAGPS